MLKSLARPLKNEKGMAAMELIPIVVVIALLINFSLGFFGVVHTGILNSMAARNYAFETFRNRTNLVYFRDYKNGASDSYAHYHSRAHGVASEKRAPSDSNSEATLRDIAFAHGPTDQGSSDIHDPKSFGQTGIFSIVEHTRYTDDGVTPVWVRPMYGICLDATCKPSP